MGITFGLLEKLEAQGLFGRGEPKRVLDIGTSNLYQANVNGVTNFVRRFHPNDDSANIATFADKIAKGSAYDPVKGGLNKAFAGEVLERCGLE